MKFKIPAFWQAVLVIVVAYLIFDNAFPPVTPKTLLIQYMAITVIAVLLYYSSNDERWAEFLTPIQSVLRDDDKAAYRWFFLLAIPAVIAYTTYGMVKPSFDAPVELRQVHPAPPSKLKVFGKTYDLTKLENPIRIDVLEKMESSPDEAWADYTAAVDTGREIYYQNCFYCHGDLLDGQGPYAKGFNPMPANFQDVGTIAQLQEAFLFWRITTGGPGLPKEGTPWNSAMPVWHEMLDERQVWSTITFLYDYVGQVPRMWDADISKVVTGMKNKLEKERSRAEGDALYQFRCAACHGEQGMGDGPAADFLYPRPRDFSLALFKYKTTPGSLPPSDEDLVRIIKHGLPGTGMPGWSTLLSDKQIRSLVPVLKGFDVTATYVSEDADEDAFDDEGRYTGTDFISITEREPVEGQLAYSEESVAKGKQVFEACAKCHGDAGRGNITSGKKLEDDWGGRIWPRDLSKPWTWRATNPVGDELDTPEVAIQKIYTRLSIGITGTPMPAHRAVEEGNKDPISLEDRWHVANYVYSLREGQPVPGASSVINGIEVEGALPEAVDDAAWAQAPATAMLMVPNIIKDERLFTPLNDMVSVQVLFNKDEIAFLLTLNDRTDSRPGEPTTDQIRDDSLESYSDAFAIQFPKQESYESAPVVVKPLYRHGDKAHPTTIWYWNAGNYVEGEGENSARTMLLDASGPNEKIQPRMEDKSLTAKGNWQDGQWTVLMKRARTGGDSGDIDFTEGSFLPISFANWDGSNGEVGSKHTLTTWYWLLLPPKLDAMKVYGIPLVLFLLVFVAGLLVVRSQRNKKLK